MPGKFNLSEEISNEKNTFRTEAESILETSVIENMSKIGAKVMGSSNSKEPPAPQLSEIPNVLLETPSEELESKTPQILSQEETLVKTPQQVYNEILRYKIQQSQPESFKIKIPKQPHSEPHKTKTLQQSPNEFLRTRLTASRLQTGEPSRKSFIVDDEISFKRSVSSGDIPTKQEKVREFMKRVVKGGLNSIATPRVRRHHRPETELETQETPDAFIETADEESEITLSSSQTKKKRKKLSELEKLALDDANKPKNTLKYHTANLQRRREQLMVKRHVRGKVRLAQGLRAHARIKSPPHVTTAKASGRMELPKGRKDNLEVPNEQVVAQIEDSAIVADDGVIENASKQAGKLKRKYKRKFGTYHLGKKPKKKPTKKIESVSVSLNSLSSDPLDSNLDSTLDVTNELNDVTDDLNNVTDDLNADMIEDSSVDASAVSSHVEADSDICDDKMLDEASVMEDDNSNMDDESPAELEGQLSDLEGMHASDKEQILEENGEFVMKEEEPDEELCTSPNDFVEDSVALPSEEPNSPNPLESAKINISKLANKPQKARKSSNTGNGLALIDDNDLLNGQETPKTNDTSESLGVAGSVKKRHDIKRKLMETEDFDSSPGINSDFIPTPKKIKKGDEAGTPQTTTEVVEEYKEKDAGIIIKPPDDDLAPCLCTCRLPEGFIQNPIAPNMESLRHEVLCQAVDSVDEKLIGCCNLVSSKWLCRPSARIPFHPLCDIHRARLRFHHCCPSCGFFCTQGSFILCTTIVTKTKTSAHLFHRKCWLRSSNGEIGCPHCGMCSGHDEVRLKLNCPRNPFILKEALNKTPKARMSLTRDVVKVEDPVIESLPGLDVAQGKKITAEDLPSGPERDELTAILERLADDTSTPAGKYTMKNFYKSAKEGELEKIIEMLKMGFDPGHNFEEYYNRTALHAAALNGHFLVAYVLLQAGGNPDSIDDNRSTPLMLAVENRQLRLVQLLIKAGTHLEARGEDGMSVLHLSAKVGNLEACTMILNTGKINVNIQDDGGWTSLVWAAEHKHEDLVALLLERGSDPNMSDVEGNVALHWAALSGNAQICELLVNSCDISCINDPGDTPLHIAARQDNYDCASLLLNKKADPTVKNKSGETPIMCCLDQTSMTYLLLSVNTQLKEISDKRTRTTRVVHPDISCGKEPNPIQCINSADDEPLPTNYLYIMENCETSRLNIDRTINCLQGCSCTDDCASPGCTCGSLSLKCWYTREGRLIPEFNLMDPPMLFECNRACRCWKKCNNRVVQHGITCHLQLFRTVGRGWGVRTLQDIPKGTFVCEYIGELISDQEADHRADDSYLFDLDNRDEETYCIDARHYGNISRFINHLCLPNLVSVKIFIDHQDLRFPRIALFSSRDIKAYEELGFDYGDKFWIIKYKSFTCACGSEKCKYSSQTIHTTLANYSRRLTEDTADYKQLC